MGGPSREVMSTPKPLPSEVGTKKLWWRFGRTRRTSRRVPEFTMVDKTRSQLSEKSAPASAVVFDVPRSCKLSLLLCGRSKQHPRRKEDQEDHRDDCKVRPIRHSALPFPPKGECPPLPSLDFTPGIVSHAFSTYHPNLTETSINSQFSTASIASRSTSLRARTGSMFGSGVFSNGRFDLLRNQQSRSAQIQENLESEKETIKRDSLITSNSSLLSPSRRPFSPPPPRPKRSPYRVAGQTPPVGEREPASSGLSRGASSGSASSNRRSLCEAKWGAPLTPSSDNDWSDDENYFGSTSALSLPLDSSGSSPTSSFSMPHSPTFSTRLKNSSIHGFVSRILPGSGTHRPLSSFTWVSGNHASVSLGDLNLPGFVSAGNLNFTRSTSNSNSGCGVLDLYGDGDWFVKPQPWRAWTAAEEASYF